LPEFIMSSLALNDLNTLTAGTAAGHGAVVSQRVADRADGLWLPKGSAFTVLPATTPFGRWTLMCFAPTGESFSVGRFWSKAAAMRAVMALSADA